VKRDREPFFMQDELEEADFSCKILQPVKLEFPLAA
jgi:hypothetical protein